MSEFRVKDTEFCYQDELVTALEQIYGIGNVEVHDEPVLLEAYDLQDRKGEKGNIVVRRKHIGSVSNDLGFIKTSEGSYKMIVSDFDDNRNVRLPQIVANYASEVLKRRVSSRYRIKSREGNRIVLQDLRR